MKKVVSVLLFTVILCSSENYAFAEDDNSTPQDGYEALFTHGFLHDIEIVISQEEWDGLVQDMNDYAEAFNGSVQTGNYRKADFIYRGPAGDTVIEEVGLRTKGRFRIIPQDEEGVLHRAHFKVKFNETFDLDQETGEYEERDDRRFYRLRKLILRLNIDPSRRWDNSQIRELYCYDLLRRAGTYTSRTGSTRLTITIGGKQQYFGIYTLIEPIDKSFLTKRYGKDANDGNLYKCDAGGQSGAATLNALENYPAFKRNNPSFLEKLVGVKDWETNHMPTYDLKTNEDEADHTALLSFLDNLNSLSGEKLKRYLDDNFEVDRFLRYQAMNVLMGKWDDYWTYGNNSKYITHRQPASMTGDTILMRTLQ
jgi:spore coat protein CotH